MSRISTKSLGVIPLTGALVLGSTALSSPARADFWSRTIAPIGHAVENAAHDAGHAVEKAAQDTGRAVEQATHDAGNAVEKATHDTGDTAPGNTACVAMLVKDRDNLGSVHVLPCDRVSYEERLEATTSCVVRHVQP